MRHITQQENTFLLSTAHAAMLLQITKYGHVELLHVLAVRSVAADLLFYS